MALKTLSTFLSPLSLPNTKFPQFLTIKPSLILCEFPRSQKSRLLAADSEGTGAAAPSPGEKFLERQQSFEDAKIILKENKKKRKKKDNAIKASRAVASCYGCGAPLHTSDADAPGYVDPETYELKKKHHQLRTVLCRRCRLLSHGKMITAVGGHGGYPGGKLFVTAEELREKLSHLRHEKALIVKLVDIVDFNGSFLSRVRDLAGSNPIILVVTKVDLLPRDTDLHCVGDWVVEATMRKKLNVLSVHLTSSKSLVGITGVISEIQKEKKGRDVYILGSANVGKSAFINALLKTMAINDPVAASAQRYKPIQSAVPGTTLGPIQINAFLGGGKLYDTPGVHLYHRQTAVVHSEDLPILAPQSRLRGLSFPSSIVSSVEEGASTIVNGLNAFSIFWGGLVRIDVLKVLPETCLTFYGPKRIPIHMVPTEQAVEFYQTELGVLLTPPSGGENAENWKGLESERKLLIKFEDVDRYDPKPACDIAISGLGWFTVEPVSRSLKISQPKPVETAGELILAVHVPKAVEIFVRSPIPVGKAGAEWYQYVELTEKQEEMRPKWYF
ncbi:NO-associated protein 1, chloroplastic/mitochondrial-like isoform X1 [Glycine soja]|uniref:NO-associated protein 1, chloroplastic/mitochondrial-like isoform X1 n=1 Tax=Glycine soja TaxID=3848 RepID=UPI00103A8A69|nr:NO-associated protein 1, chloroplastic/mitochondrial-like isoform X1 [Glycine soja]